MLTPQFFSVPQIAEMLSVKTDKVHHWIATNELAAFNAATNRSGRPRWRISADAFADFQASRAAAPAKPIATRRRKPVRPVSQSRQWIT